MNDPNDDLLTRATHAMRAATSPNLDDDEAVAASTLARVERSTRTRRSSSLKKRAITRWVAMPIAASFIVFAAWASASGRLSQWVSRTHQEDEHAVRTPDPMQSTSSSPAVALPLPPLPPPLPVIEPLPEEEPSATPAPSAIKAPSASAIIDTDALYREAHDAHFVRKDPAAALASWDRYLAVAGPSGRFTLEARYNRAISLVRLGRRAEAATALRPFANGDYGGYRRDEARELLRTLE
jgi:hypothetical protein